MKALLLLVCGVATVLADTSGAVAQGEAGHWRVTLFASPFPLRAGPAKIAVLIQTAGSLEPCGHCEISLSVQDPNGSVRVLNGGRVGSNRPLYEALWTVPSPGQWRVVTAIEKNGVRAEASFPVTVLNAPEPVLSYIPYVLPVPAGLLLMALNRIRRRKRKRLRNDR